MAASFVVLNADVLHRVDLTQLLAAVRPDGAAMALRPDPEHAERYGIVAADTSHTVVQLVRLATAPSEGSVATDTHFSGIHAMQRDALDRVPPEGAACVVRTVYQQLVPLRRVAGLRYDGPWLDAGDPAAYLDANLDLLQQRVSLALDPFPRAAWSVDASGRSVGMVPPGVHIDGPCWVGPGAVVGRGARLSGVVVGHGAHIAEGALLTDTVIWDGATVSASPLSRAVVHDGGTWSEAT